MSWRYHLNIDIPDFQKHLSIELQLNEENASNVDTPFGFEHLIDINIHTSFYDKRIWFSISYWEFPLVDWYP